MNTGSFEVFTYVIAYILFLVIRSRLQSIEQNERLSISNAPIGLHISRKWFGPFFHIEFHQNKVVLNMHFVYQMFNGFAPNLA